MRNQKNFTYDKNKTENLFEETINIAINESLDNFLDLIDEVEKQKLEHFSIALRETFNQYGVSVFFKLKDEVSQILFRQFATDFRRALGKMPLFKPIEWDKFNQLGMILQSQNIEYLVILLQKDRQDKSISFDFFYHFKKRKTALIVKKLLTNLMETDTLGE